MLPVAYTEATEAISFYIAQLAHRMQEYRVWASRGHRSQYGEIVECLIWDDFRAYYTIYNDPGIGDGSTPFRRSETHKFIVLRGEDELLQGRADIDDLPFVGLNPADPGHTTYLMASVHKVESMTQFLRDLVDRECRFAVDPVAIFNELDRWTVLTHHTAPCR
jgi:hypothetical protein